MRKLNQGMNVRGRRMAHLATPLAAFLAITALCSLPVAAEHTRFWRQADYYEFDQGTAHGVALRSDGRLVLAPKFMPLGDSNLAYLWSLRTDSHGNLYAAGGSNAKVVRFDSAGKATTVFESTEMTAQTIALDKADNLYVGTSPDGKVYRVTPDGKQSVFFDPKMKYIWDLALAPDGALYVATGDTGKIFVVTPDGKGVVFYDGEETHIRTLALDGKGNLLAGTEPNGRVLRISLFASETSRRDADRTKNTAGSQSDGEAGRSAYVIYETPKKEITSLVLDSAGNLYVAAIGDKSRPLQGITQMQPVAPQPAAVAAGQGGGATIVITPTVQPQPAPTVFVPFPSVNSSAVYRIAPDGAPEEIWTDRDEIVYTMALAADGSLLLGTGNQGAIIQLDGDRVFSRLAKTESAQVTSFARLPNGKIFVATANPGKVFSLGPELESEGTFESQTFDARIFSRWGRLSWWGKNGTGSGVEFYVRSGNTSDPGNNWSSWFGPYKNAAGQEVESPASRFVQWKAVLHGGSAPVPEVWWVDLAYLPKNVAPQIGEIAVQNPGVRVLGFAGQAAAGPAQQVSVQLRVPPAPGSQPTGGNRQRSGGETTRFDAPSQGVAQKGYQTVLWSADDANDDDLTYSIYYRGEAEQDWKLLKDHLEQNFYSWDTTSMPDGAYYLKIVASDDRSNPPGDALKTERVSDRFVVDNTPPVIADMAAQPTAGGDTTVRFRATDATSAIVRAQYSLDAGDWTLAPPAGYLSDSPDEHYSIALKGLMPGEHTLALRAYDQFDNEAAAKVTFTIPPGGKR